MFPFGNKSIFTVILNTKTYFQIQTLAIITHDRRHTKTIIRIKYITLVIPIKLTKILEFLQ